MRVVRYSVLAANQMMREARRFGVVTAALGVAVASAVTAGSSPLDAQVPSGSVEGRVIDSVSGTPLSGAAVLVPGSLWRTTTNDRGVFHLRGIVPGHYTIRVAIIGFESATIPVQVRVDSASQVDVLLRKAVVELAEVAVTASAGAEKPGDTPASEAVISRNEIVDRNVLTVDQALVYAPGVIVTSNNNNQDVDIRGSTGVAGGNGSRVMVMLDGHPVLSGDGESVDFTALPLLDVQRIEVVKGGYSALYGSNALGGVVNVLTTPIDQASTAIGLHYGYYDLPEQHKFTDRALGYEGIELERSQRIGENVGARLFLDRESNAGYLQDDGLNRWLAYSKLVFNPDGQHPSSFYGIYKYERDGNFLGWEDPNHPYQVPPSEANDHSVAARVSLGGTLTPLARGTQHIDLNPYLDYNLDRDSFPSDTINPNKYHRSTRLGTRMMWSFIPGARQALTIGADVAGTFVESDELSNHTLGDAGVYAQDQVSVTSRVSAIGGVRYDWHGVDAGASEGSVSPKVGLVYKPTSNVSMRISVGHGYRAPSIIEQYTTAYEDGFNVVANPSLRGESSWSGEIGATDRLARWLWTDAAIYQTDYWGLIGPQVIGPSHVDFQNITRARIRGADVSTRATVIPNIFATEINYTYLDPQDIVTHEWLPYRSRHNFTGSLDFVGGLCGVDLHYRSRVEQVLLYAGDPRSDITVVDLRAGYRVFGTLLQLKVINIFQEQYVNVEERIPGQPRTVFFSALKFF
jgi:outer membrane receptor protein involved in Fe transport